MDCNSPFTEVVTIPGTIISSSNYPNNYDNNQDCQIKIAFEEGQRVLLEFIHFDVEYISSCSYDWLEIRDGPSADSSMLVHNLCGSTIPNPILSTGNALTLIFRTDSGVTGSGFLIKAQIGKICVQDKNKIVTLNL